MKLLTLTLILFSTVGFTLAQQNPYSSFGHTSQTDYEVRELGQSENDDEAYYRFGFNGQESSKEISWNHYTAQHWEYDSRLGRRWNSDPRPVTSISSYATFANNPIRLSDPKGDTAVIRWRTGFLGLGKKHEARYVNGTWIDSQTRTEIDQSTIRRGGIKRLMQDYEILNSIEEFSPVTGLLNSISNVINLRWNGEPSTNSRRYFKQLLRGRRPIALPEITVNAGLTRKGDKELYTNGDNRQLSYMVLGHELGHVWDLLLSGSSFENFVPIDGLHKSISRSEITAMYWENVLRANAGYGLREWYYFSKTATPDYQLRSSILTLSNSRKIIRDRTWTFETEVINGYVMKTLHLDGYQEPASTEQRAQTGRK